MSGPIYQISQTELEGIIERSVNAAIAKVRATPPILTKAQAAEYLGKTVPTIDRYMREGIPFRKIDGGHPEFLKSDIDRWLSERFQKVSRQANHAQRQELV
jgi:excisionase family DNA binding protein